MKYKFEFVFYLKTCKNTENAYNITKTFLHDVADLCLPSFYLSSEFVLKKAKLVSDTNNYFLNLQVFLENDIVHFVFWTVVEQKIGLEIA